MALEHPEFDCIVSDPAILDGQPCIRGTRLTVKRVLSIIAELKTPDAIAEGFPQLDEESIRQALTFAAANLDEKIAPFKHAS
ncbi:MAG: DUF433 domain-containing protein [Phycisphaeraceae bacterium]